MELPVEAGDVRCPGVPAWGSRVAHSGSASKTKPDDFHARRFVDVRIDHALAGTPARAEHVIDVSFFDDCGIVDAGDITIELENLLEVAAPGSMETVAAAPSVARDRIIRFRNRLINLTITPRCERAVRASRLERAVEAARESA
jgi:hypothetical protein